MVIDGTRHWLRISNLFKKPLKEKDVSALTRNVPKAKAMEILNIKFFTQRGREGNLPSMGKKSNIKYVVIKVLFY